MPALARDRVNFGGVKLTERSWTHFRKNPTPTSLPSATNLDNPDLGDIKLAKRLVKFRGLKSKMVPCKAINAVVALQPCWSSLVFSGAGSPASMLPAFWIFSGGWRVSSKSSAKKYPPHWSQTLMEKIIILPQFWAADQALIIFRRMKMTWNALKKNRTGTFSDRAKAKISAKNQKMTFLHRWNIVCPTKT